MISWCVHIVNFWIDKAMHQNTIQFTRFIHCIVYKTLISFIMINSLKVLLVYCNRCVLIYKFLTQSGLINLLANVYYKCVSIRKWDIKLINMQFISSSWAKQRTLETALFFFFVKGINHENGKQFSIWKWKETKLYLVVSILRILNVFNDFKYLEDISN